MLHAFIKLLITVLIAAVLPHGGLAAIKAACTHGDDRESVCDPALRHVMETVTMMELDAPKKEDFKLQLLQTHRAKRNAPTPEQDPDKTTKLAGAAEQEKHEVSHFSKRPQGIGLQLASNVVEEHLGTQAGLETWGDADIKKQKVDYPTSQVIEAVPAADGWDGNVSLSVVSGMMADMEKGSEGSDMLDFVRKFLILFVIVALALPRLCYVVDPACSCSCRKRRSASSPVPEIQKSPAHTYTETFRVSSIADVEHRIAELREGSDANPQVPSKPMRIQARVDGLVDGGTLLTPLTQRACTVYSAAAKCDKGPGLVAFAMKAPKFVVSVVGAPLLQLEVKGEDISLFDMSAGKWSHHQPLISAPEQMQDFVLTHMDMAPERECQTICALREAPGIDFQENALLVGQIVSLVGDLRRSPEGRLQLHPFQDAACGDLQLEKWRNPTSFCQDEDEPIIGTETSEKAPSDTSVSKQVSATRPMLLVSDSMELLSSLPRAGTVKSGDAK